MLAGIDIGGTKCAVVLGDGGRIVKQTVFQTAGYSETMTRIFHEIEKLGQFEAIGISCGGPVDIRQGVIQSPPNLPGWENVPIVSMLEKQFGVPASLQNDANACAIAEWRFGAGQGTKNLIFLTFGTGLGAGLILEGKLYCGTNGMAGEIGHIRMADTGPVGFGKAGSLEGFCSGGGIAQLGRMRALEQFQAGKTVSFCKDGDFEAITAKSIGISAEDGDEDAAEVFAESGRMLGLGLSILIDILNPEKIIVGSIYARSRKLLEDEMNRVIAREALERARAVCEIVPAALGDELGSIAALAVAQDRLDTLKFVE